MKILLFGHGKMGKMVEKLAFDRGDTIVSHSPDVCIDFSHADAVIDHIQSACEMQRPIIIGTTGWEAHIPHAKDLIEEHQIAALYAPNFSIGMARFFRLLEYAQSLFMDYDVAGVEFHHHQKKDAPSGTAKQISNLLQIPTFSSVRCGTITGKHQLVFDSSVDSVILTHEAKSREGFAMGALQAAEWISDRKGWFILDDMLDSFNHSLR